MIIIKIMIRLMRKTKKLSKESQQSVIKTCHKQKKTILRCIKEKKYQEFVQYKKDALKNN